MTIDTTRIKAAIDKQFTTTETIIYFLFNSNMSLASEDIRQFHEQLLENYQSTSSADASKLSIFDLITKNENNKELYGNLIVSLITDAKSSLLTSENKKYLERFIQTGFASAVLDAISPFEQLPASFFDLIKNKEEVINLFFERFQKEHPEVIILSDTNKLGILEYYYIHKIHVGFNFVDLKALNQDLEQNPKGPSYYRRELTLLNRAITEMSDDLLVDYPHVKTYRDKMIKIKEAQNTIKKFYEYFLNLSIVEAAEIAANAANDDRVPAAFRDQFLGEGSIIPPKMPIVELKNRKNLQDRNENSQIKFSDVIVSLQHQMKSDNKEKIDEKEFLEQMLTHKILLELTGKMQTFMFGCSSCDSHSKKEQLNKNMNDMNEIYNFIRILPASLRGKVLLKVLVNLNNYKAYSVGKSNYDGDTFKQTEYEINRYAIKFVHTSISTFLDFIKDNVINPADKVNLLRTNGKEKSKREYDADYVPLYWCFLFAENKDNKNAFILFLQTLDAESLKTLILSKEMFDKNNFTNEVTAALVKCLAEKMPLQTVKDEINKNYGNGMLFHKIHKYYRFLKKLENAISLRPSMTTTATSSNAGDASAEVPTVKIKLEVIESKPTPSAGLELECASDEPPTYAESIASTRPPAYNPEWFETLTPEEQDQALQDLKEYIKVESPQPPTPVLDDVDASQLNSSTVPNPGEVNGLFAQTKSSQEEQKQQNKKLDRLVELDHMVVPSTPMPQKLSCQRRLASSINK